MATTRSGGKDNVDRKDDSSGNEIEEFADDFMCCVCLLRDSTYVERQRICDSFSIWVFYDLYHKSLSEVLSGHLDFSGSQTFVMRLAMPLFSILPPVLPTVDLVYKPVVLACGHISCFWCVFEAMGYSWQESRCPVCRQSYNHFPSICRQLHFVLLKLYPLTYKRRERQVAEEEKKCGTFSPQFDDYLCESYSSKEFSRGSSSLETIPDSLDKLQLEPCCVKEGGTSLAQKKSEVVPTDRDVTAANPVNLSDEAARSALQGVNVFRGKAAEGHCKQVLITDILCALCKYLLCRPVVLNCGHVFCEACILVPSNKLCRCPVCQSLHPNGFPKVCLVIEHFLEEHVSEEYAARRVAVGKLCNSENGSPSTAGSLQAQQDNSKSSSPSTDDHTFSQARKVHFGVGCDCCGMYPITGERYKCKDCVEDIGFDLCDACYKSSSKLPGRFNQQHTPEHKFEILEPSMIFLAADYLEGYGPYSPQDLMAVFPISGPSREAQSDSEAGLSAPNSSNGSEEASEP